ncbi:hypothetical protein J7T55_002221 [Diaporthe amygdali]|uniref:uncharacterized protein n=1 Tax=Phomopsis amygdali TaxID=1214568 RepID=UPI0022FE7178|nr:uncharacterized protein J7T55_002221 [Diaporthe amygdali]KAJ0109029.1 hypothetical protein J7T55_002221 [Diaporthe amygdali]
MVAQKFGAALAALMSSTAAASSISRHRNTARAATPVVHLDNGLSVQGRIAPAASTVAEFLGIPYAQPPVDDLRWAPPQDYEVASNNSVVNATALPPSCWQYISVHPGILRTDAPEYMIGNAGMAEDCLTMSIWAPAKALEAEEGLPVLIWFYGGGFATGGIDVPYQIPVNWIERSQSHIVVSFNYRLNIFGFPTAAGLTEQNFGLMDQRFAVEWIKENIAKFGGDPERMVIWGQSAGSTAVDLYNFAYAEEPIVKGLIMDSGTAHLDILINRENTDFSSFSLVAANLGCGNQTSSEAELACMRKVPASKLENFVATYEDSGASPSINFIPVVDDNLVFNNYTQKAADGEMSDLPAIIGFNENEGLFLTTYNATNPDFATALEYSYDYFWCPATLTTYERLENNRITHRYYYTGNFTNISPQPWMGAYHESELPMLFGTHMDFRGNSTPFEYAVSHTLQDAYVAFVADPVNGLNSIGWPAYEGPGGTVMQWADMSNLTLAHLTTVTEIEEGCQNKGLLTSLAQGS